MGARTALEEAAHWPDQVRIAVNLSPIQFNDPHIVDIVARCSPNRVFAPSGSSSRSPRACSSPTATPPTSTFARLKALGVRLALDDFGTGYSRSAI
jgi:EAL domain-containing protein (putative c-di-GMP-specific phosphodiesterase class I)